MKIVAFFCLLLQIYGMFLKSPQQFFQLTFFCLSGLTLSSTLAADQFILPAGAGTKDGSSWENAKTGKDFQAAWDALAPGETLNIGSGTYEGAKISSNKSGTAGKSIKLKGVDRGEGYPLLTSNFDRNNPEKSGATFFEAKFGVTNFEIEGFRLKGYKCAVFMRGRHSDVKISKLLVEEAREGIRSEGGGTLQNPEAGTHGVSISDCRFINFTKRGIRLEGGNYRWKIERCYVDAGGKEWGTEPFHMGFQVANKSLKDSSMEHDITFIDCTALNSYAESTGKMSEGKPVEQKYWNGDGFCAEAGAKQLRYIRCVSMHHTDGGWDDKSDGPEFVDCVSIDNKENFRLWSKKEPAKMTNVLSAFALKRGGSGPQTGLWILGSIHASNSTFIGNSSQISMDAEKSAPDGKLIFKDCIFADGKLSENPKIQLIDCMVAGEGSNVDAGIAARAEDPWKNGTKVYDSTTQPTKGFSMTRWGKINL